MLKNMINIVVKILGILLVLAGVVLIYDARNITNKFFWFGDQNEGSSGLKIIGFIIAIVGGIIIFVVK